MPQVISERAKLWYTFARNRTALIGGGFAVLLILVSLFAPLIAPYDPLKQNFADRLAGSSMNHILGTDDFGRDILSRIIWGSRVSLMIGCVSVALGMAIGTAMGLIAGFFGGKLGNTIMRITDLIMCFPDLILAVAVTAALGANFINLVFVIAIVMAPKFARIAQGVVLSLKDVEYVIGAKASGCKSYRILVKHILPNIFGDIIVAGTLWIGGAIRLEANLAFIGLGIQPPTPTWGNMTREGIDVLINAPWLSLYSGLSIFIAILAFNMLGDGIRDVTDPKLRGA